MTSESIHAMILNCPEDLQAGPFVQSKETLLKVDTTLMNEKLNLFLDFLTNKNYQDHRESLLME